MAKKSPESVTMRVRIGDRELEVIGPCEYVDKKIAEFISVHQKIVTAAGGASAIPSSSSGGHGAKATSPAQFFKKVNPRTDNDRALAAAYYIELIKKDESFTSSEVKDTIQKEAKTTPPKNISDVINQNIKKGLMMAAGDKDGKRAYVLTSDGIEYIDTLLNA